MAFKSDAIYKRRQHLASVLLGMALTACMILFMPQVCISADVIETLRFEDRWPDASVGNLAHNPEENELYFAAGNFLTILNADDLSEKARIEITILNQESEQEQPARGITGIVQDPDPDRPYVYAACGPQGIAIVNVLDQIIEATLSDASEISTEEDLVHASAVDYDPDGKKLYVADVFHGLRCIDVSNTEDPSQDWAYEQKTAWQEEEDEESGGHINVNIKSGNNTAVDYEKLAFVLDQYYGLRIFDVENQPTEPLASFDMRSRTFFGQYSEVVDVVVSDDCSYAYVTDLNYGVTILDIPAILSDPEAKHVGQIETPGTASGLELSDDSSTLFVADGNRGMLVADVSDPDAAENEDPPDFPENKVEEETYAATGSYAVLAASGKNTAFLASGRDGLSKLSNTEALRYEKDYEYSPPARITGLYVDEGYAYILDDDGPEEGLRILRLRDKDTDRSRLDGFIATAGTANSVAVHGAFAHVADGTEGLAVIDIEDKTNPQEIDDPGLITVGNAQDIKIYEHDDSVVLAYIADLETPGLVIAEINEETGKLEETGPGGSIDNALAVDVFEQEEGDETSRYAAVVTGGSLTIFDVTDPEAPAEMGDIETNDSRDVAVTNQYGTQYAIVADGSGGLLLIDISDPAAPELADSYLTDSPAEDVSLYGPYIHAAVGDKGVVVVGISDTDPVELTPMDLDSEDETNPYFNTPGYAADVFIAEPGDQRYTYVADRHGGFLELYHDDTLGEGINEQPFTDSPDDSSRIECFISSLF